MIRQLYYKLRWLPGNLKNHLIFRLKRVQKGSNLKTLGSIFVRGKGIIKIGNNVAINSSLESNPIGGGYRTIFYIKDGAELSIGNNVGISNSAFYSEARIIIEDNVLIGNGCKIYDSNFHSTDYMERRNHNENVVSMPVHIKSDAFIGAHAIILKGVTVGEKSIIAAGSVVVRSVPAGEVWGGNPACFIKKIDE